MTPFIIAVAGMPGAGKSTLIRNAVQELGDADSLQFDDYTRGNDYPNIPQWVAAGCDPNQWVSPRLGEHLALLKRGRKVHTPNTDRVVEPRRFIFLEEPFGRGRIAVAAHVDMDVAIDLPIDVALARRLVRDINTPQMAADPQAARDHVDSYCRKFLFESRRELILAGQRWAMKNCDLVLDGMKPMAALTAELLTALDEFRSEKPQRS
jgi:uridine kinase